MTTKTITDKNIQQALDKNSIIFLDFWASWCEPCKIFRPIFERIAEQNPDLFFGTINSESENELVRDFQIASIPTLVILKEGTIIYSESGAIPEYAMKEIVKKARMIDVSTLEED